MRPSGHGIHAMRRQAAFALLFLLAPVAMRLAVASLDLSAQRCPIDCPHAKVAANGAACCPMGAAAAGGLEFRCCSHGADIVPAPFGQAPVVLPPTTRLWPPRRSRAAETSRASNLRSAFLRCPDKVPLRAG